MTRSLEQKFNLMRLLQSGSVKRVNLSQNFATFNKTINSAKNFEPNIFFEVVKQGKMLPNPVTLVTASV